MATFNECLSYLREINLLSIILRVALTLLIGGLLGLERGKKHRPAGFRTHMLVCLGATMVMMTNQFVAQEYGTGDPVRMGAQVVSGIGFLGAGTIMVTGKQQVKGITTAAGLWTAACCGLAIGIGFYEAAIVCGVTIWFIMTFFARIDAQVHRMGKSMELYVEFHENTRVSDFTEYIREMDMEVLDIQLQRNTMREQGSFYSAVLIVRCHYGGHEKTLELLASATGVYYIEELQ
jgi:Uncharacterized membrane protein